jgi:hypothetical protein
MVILPSLAAPAARGARSFDLHCEERIVPGFGGDVEAKSWRAMAATCRG